MRYLQVLGLAPEKSSIDFVFLLCASRALLKRYDVSIYRIRISGKSMILIVVNAGFW